MVGFFLVTLVLFCTAFYGVGFYIWSVPQQHAADELGGRLRELRVNARSRSNRSPELLRREQRGRFAFLGGLATWVGVLRRLQEIIDQADLRYRAADLFGMSLALATGIFLTLMVFGGAFFLLRLLIALIAGFLPIGYVLRVRKRRLKRFEEMLPDAINL